MHTAKKSAFIVIDMNIKTIVEVSPGGKTVVSLETFVTI
jgi:hypothetical protein